MENTHPASQSGTKLLPIKLFSGRLRMRHLELFRATCELQSLRKAADACHITQPAATKLMQDFEELFGSPLFLRNRQGMHITQLGEIVRRQVNTLLGDLANMHAEIQLFSEGGSGCIRLGYVPSLDPVLLADAITAMRQRWPHIRFQTKEGASTDLQVLLARNELDVVFGRIVDASMAQRLICEEVYSESFCIVTSANNSSIRRGPHLWRDLAQASWVMPPAGTPLRSMADHIFVRHKLHPPVACIEATSFHHIGYMIARSDLVGILPSAIATQAKYLGDLTLLQTGLRQDLAPIKLMWRNDVELHPAVQHFITVVHRTAQAMQLAPS